MCCSLVGVTGEAIAQTSSASSTEQLAFDRPEAWAMKYFTSATSLSGLSTPDSSSAGSLAVQFEVGRLPTLSAAQERVGFDGTTPEDLNKAPVFLRPRVTIGLPRRLSLIIAVDPPIRAFGVTPRLLALGIDGALHDSGTWRFGWRAHGQIGTVTAAFTCPANVAPFAPGSMNNPAGCTAESSDVTTLRYAGVELQAARRIWTPIRSNARDRKLWPRRSRSPRALAMMSVQVVISGRRCCHQRPLLPLLPPRPSRLSLHEPREIGGR
jgi:hypothetical protein